MCKQKGKCCKLIIDNGSTNNLVSLEKVDKLGLERMAHPTPYKVSWLQKGHQVLRKKQFQVDFQIGTYRNQVLCGIMHMGVYHVLLGRPWQLDWNVAYDGRKNSYTFEKNGRKHTRIPLKDEKEEKCKF